MTSYLLSLSVEDSRHFASSFEPIVDSQTTTLRAVLKDYFDDLNKLKEGDEFHIEIRMTEPEIFRLWIFRWMREQDDIDVKGTYAASRFIFTDAGSDASSSARRRRVSVAKKESSPTTLLPSRKNGPKRGSRTCTNDCSQVLPK